MVLENVVTGALETDVLPNRISTPKLFTES